MREYLNDSSREHERRLQDDLLAAIDPEIEDSDTEDIVVLSHVAAFRLLAEVSQKEILVKM